jgi:hypothetical protein
MGDVMAERRPAGGRQTAMMDFFPPFFFPVYRKKLKY